MDSEGTQALLALSGTLVPTAPRYSNPARPKANFPQAVPPPVWPLLAKGPITPRFLESGLSSGTSPHIY